MLEVEGLHAGYNGLRVLSGISLHVHPGESVVVVSGWNGAGKSTLLKCIMGMLKPWEGRVLVEGRDLGDLAVHQRGRLGVGYVPQGRRLFTQMSVRENLEIGLLARGASRKHRMSRMDDVLGSFKVLSGLLNRRAGELSGGQQQLVALAQALMVEPKVLLLDEPSLGLQDPKVVQEVYEYIKKLARLGIALVLVEQYIRALIEVGDRFYLLSEGKVVESGDPKVFEWKSCFQRGLLTAGPDSMWSTGTHDGVERTHA